MSIDLATAKSFLDVIHNSDDDKLQTLLDGAIDEAVRYMNVESLGAIKRDDDAVPASAVVGVMLLLQAAYQASPDDVPKLRAAAEVKLTPYRVEMGV